MSTTTSLQHNNITANSEIKLQLVENEVISLTTVVDGIQLNVDKLTSIVSNLRDIFTERSAEIKLLTYRVDSLASINKIAAEDVQAIKTTLTNTIEQLDEKIAVRMEGFERRIGINERWRNTIIIGAVVLYFILDKMGFIDRFLAQ